jgi:hypothetical protein
MINPFPPLLDQVEQYFGSESALEGAMERIAQTDRMGPLIFVGLPGTDRPYLLQYLSAPRALAVCVQKYADFFEAPYRDVPGLLMPVHVQFRDLALARVSTVEFLYQTFREAVQRYFRRIKFTDEYLSLGKFGVVEAVESVLSKALPLAEFAETAESARDQKALKSIREAVKQLSAGYIRPVLLLDDFDVSLLSYGQSPPPQPEAIDQATSIKKTDRDRKQEQEDYLNLLRSLRGEAAILLGAARSLRESSKEVTIYLGVSEEFFFAGLDDTGQDSEVKRVLEKGALYTTGYKLLKRWTGNHFYLLITGARVMWDYCQEQGLNSSADLENDDALRSLVNDALQSRFTQYWEALTGDEKNALLEVVKGGNWQTSVELGKDNWEKRMASSLIKLNLLVRDNPSGSGKGLWVFSELFFQYAEAMNQIAPRGARAHQGYQDRTESLRRFLFANLNQTCTYEEIYTAVWGQPEEEMDEVALKKRQGAVRTLVSRLQDHLAARPNNLYNIENVRGVGYRMWSQMK